MEEKKLTAEEKAKTEAEAKLKELENADNTTLEENTKSDTTSAEKNTAKTEEKPKPKKAKTATYNHAVKVNGKWYDTGENVPLIK